MGGMATNGSNNSGGIRVEAPIETAARLLASGDPLGALNWVALREDAPALALRGIAMAQLGDLARARELLKRAIQSFPPGEMLARARCVLADAEIALVTRDLTRLSPSLESAIEMLDVLGDRLNSAHARHVQVRRLLLLGRLAEAETALAEIDATQFPPPLRTAHELAVAGMAIRRLRARDARAALERADIAASGSRIALLQVEVERGFALLEAPAARLIAQGCDRLIVLEEVEDVMASGALLVDACRNAVRHGDRLVLFSARPVLFALARALGEAWPDEVPRAELVERAFELQLEDDDDRQRLRVEIGRLRKAMQPLADVIATRNGFALVPREPNEVAVLAPPEEEVHAEVLALLADGESWSSSALALALGSAQRSVQRSLEALAAAGKVQPIGQGRSRKWMVPFPVGITTPLLLPGSLPSGYD